MLQAARGRSSAVKGWPGTRWRRVALLMGVSTAVCAAGFVSAASAASTVTVNCARGGDLQGAIDHAGTSDTTIVIRGTCHGNFVVPTEDLGALTLQGTPGAALNGQGTGAALSIDALSSHSTRTVSMQGLRVRNGRPGIKMSSSSTIYPLTLRNVVVSGNESDGSARRYSGCSCDSESVLIVGKR